MATTYEVERAGVSEASAAPTYHVGLVSESGAVTPSELTRVVAALQWQVSYEFREIWDVQCIIGAFFRLEDVPDYYWPIVVVPDVGEGTPAGSHGVFLNRPYARVQKRDPWSLAASHELLEMLANPYRQRSVNLPLPQDSGRLVTYPVEVCDPCQAVSYQVNGVDVSDFCTPSFYKAGTHDRPYDFRDEIDGPLEVLNHGFISWYDPETCAWRVQGYESEAEPVGALEQEARVVPEDTGSELPPAPEPEQPPPKFGAAEFATLREVLGPVQATGEVPWNLLATVNTTRSQYYNLVRELANNTACYEEFRANPRAVYRRYGIDIPQELLPHQVKLPSQKQLRNKLAAASVDPAFGIAPYGDYGLPFFSDCSFMPG